MDLKARRISLGMTLQQVATKVGVTLWTVSYWERGIGAPTAPNWVRLANALQLDPATGEPIEGSDPVANWSDEAILADVCIHVLLSSMQNGGKLELNDRKALAYALVKGQLPPDFTVTHAIKEHRKHGNWPKAILKLVYDEPKIT